MSPIFQLFLNSHTRFKRDRLHSDFVGFDMHAESLFRKGAMEWEKRGVLGPGLSPFRLVVPFKLEDNPGPFSRTILSPQLKNQYVPFCRPSTKDMCACMCACVCLCVCVCVCVRVFATLCGHYDYGRW